MSDRYANTSSRGRPIFTLTVTGVHGGRKHDPLARAQAGALRRGADGAQVLGEQTVSLRAGGSFAAARLADESIAVHVDDLADERGTMAVNAAVASGAEGAYAVAEERDLHQGFHCGGSARAWFDVIRVGHLETTIDPVPKIGKAELWKSASATSRTLGLCPPARRSGEPSRRDRPSWVDDARAGLNEPGKYLAYERAAATWS